MNNSYFEYKFSAPKMLFTMFIKAKQCIHQTQNETEHQPITQNDLLSLYTDYQLLIKKKGTFRNSLNETLFSGTVNKNSILYKLKTKTKNRRK